MAAKSARDKAQDTLRAAGPGITIRLNGTERTEALTAKLFSTGSVGGHWQGKLETGLTNPDGTPMRLQVNITATIIDSKEWPA